MRTHARIHLQARAHLETERSIFFCWILDLCSVLGCCFLCTFFVSTLFYLVCSSQLPRSTWKPLKLSYSIYMSLPESPLISSTSHALCLTGAVCYITLFNLHSPLSSTESWYCACPLFECPSHWGLWETMWSYTVFHQYRQEGVGQVDQGGADWPT